ncbi:MAG: hypothetical protein M3139_06815 [Bacteroidota bacterium]|nr:hypothetical protein [Bacteroidota bacterium]
MEVSSKWRVWRIGNKHCHYNSQVVPLKVKKKTEPLFARIKFVVQFKI